MRAGSIGLILLAFFMVGCDGDSTPAQQEEAEVELTGVFRAGGASGVRYSTPTRSGVTDAAGAFRYLAGETVSFSVGRLELGSALGAAEITPFTLAGVVPPTNQLELRRALERMRHEPTPLGRAVNIMRVLMVFDADRDAGNGFDVTAQAALAGGGGLAIDTHVGAFAALLQRAVPNRTFNVPYSRPLIELYRIFGITVPAHVETGVEYIHVNDTVSLARAATFDASGLLGTQRWDESGDGSAEIVTGWAYDSIGRTVEFEQAHTGLFQRPTTRRVRYEQDSRGLTVRQVEETDFEVDGQIEWRDVHDYVHDDFGFRTVDTLVAHRDADDVADVRLVTRMTYDANHNLIAQHDESDNDTDGDIDEFRQATWTYDSLQRTLRSRHEFDWDGDRIPESISETEFEYAGDNLGAATDVTTQDLGADGVIDSRHVVRRVHDSSNRLTLLESEDDDDADGIVDGRFRLELTYDGWGRRLTQLSQQDLDGDGDYDSSTLERYTYDDIGNLLESRTEYDSLGDSAFDTRTTVTYEYGANGELLGGTTEWVSAHFSILTIRSTIRVTRQELANGVAALAQQYLENNGGIAGNYPGGGTYVVVPPPGGVVGI